MVILKSRAMSQLHARFFERVHRDVGAGGVVRDANGCHGGAARGKDRAGQTVAPREARA